MRQLDQQVAMKVFNMEIHVGHHATYMRPAGEPRMAFERPLPYYSSEIADAMQVVTVVRQRGFGVTLMSHGSMTGGKHSCEIDRPEWGGSIVQTVEHYVDLPMAICQAALDAMSVDRGREEAYVP